MLLHMLASGGVPEGTVKLSASFVDNGPYPCQSVYVF